MIDLTRRQLALFSYFPMVRLILSERAPKYMVSPDIILAICVRFPVL